MSQTSKQLRHIQDSVALLYKNSINGILMCMIASTALVFAFPDSPVYDTKLVWWGIINTLMLIRFIDSILWHRLSAKDRNAVDAKFWLAKFRAGAISTAVIWGGFAVVVQNQMASVEFFTTILVLAALAGAAPTPLSADRLLATIYSCLLILPVSIVGIVDGDYKRQVLGSLGFFFGLSMCFSAFKITDFTRLAIRLKHDNKDLLDKVSKDKDKLTEKNAALEASYAEITAIKEGLEEQVASRTKALLELSQRDGLTGLFNRRTFIEKLEQRIHEATEVPGTEFAVLFVDLNKFKQVNDTQGHGSGDLILQKVAAVLRSVPGSTVVCRWGGDEFVMLVESRVGEPLQPLCKGINQEIAKATQKLASDVSAAIGFSFFPAHSKNADELVRLADIAMFVHKQEASYFPAVQFAPSLLRKLERTERLRIGLASAIVQNQLSLMFQPVYQLSTGKIHYYECLLRWIYEDEVVLPEEFIGLAEQSELIHEIGLWVLRESCQHMGNVPDSEEIKLAVNVSVLQLKHPDFAKQVFAVLTETGFDAARLHLEITESIFTNDPKSMLANISQLRMRGITFGLDDFGTGYSSMVQLQALPLTSLKVDKRFVTDIDGTGRAIIQSIIVLARELGLTVIAEGVENKKQLDSLNDMGVDLIQGYFFSKPQRKADPEFKPAVIFDSYLHYH